MRADDRGPGQEAADRRRAGREPVAGDGHDQRVDGSEREADDAEQHDRGGQRRHERGGDQRDRRDERRRRSEPGVVEPVAPARAGQAAEREAAPEQRERRGREPDRRGLEEADQPVGDADLRADVAGDGDGQGHERPGQADPAGRRTSRCGRGVRTAAAMTTVRTAIGSAASPVPRRMACHATPASTSRPTTSGEASAPRLKKRWSRLSARPRLVG